MPKLCVIPGDGIGQEVIPAALEALRAVVPGLETVDAEAGWDCYLKHGVSVPEETLAAIRACGAALFGANSSPTTGAPVSSSSQGEGSARRPYRSAIITMRQALDLYANIRPARSWPRVSPRPGVDLITFRENTEGLYAGRERMENPDTAIAERVITRKASYRITARALELAQALGRKKLTIVHKANVLPVTDGLFRQAARAAVADYAARGFQIEVEEMIVDVAAMRLAGEPERFDLIVTTNLFGDILSDITANWCGGLGLAPALNWGVDAAIAEPVHGSAPDIAGQGIANPIAAMLSAALLARYVWQMPAAAQRIEDAVEATLREGVGVERSTPTTTITAAVVNHLTTDKHR